MGRAIRIAPVVLSVAVLLGCSDAEAQAPPAREAAVLLERAQRSGDWSAQAGAARAVVTDAPTELHAWTALVGALATLGEGETAEQAARECLGHLPDRPEPALLLARALRAQGRGAEALDVLTAIEASDATPRLAAGRTRTLASAGRLDEAVEAGRAAAAAYPDAPEVHAALGAVLLATGDLRGGTLAFDRAIALDPEDPAALRERCLYHAAARHPARARRDCARYLRMRPKDPEVALLLARAYEAVGENRTAIDHYRRAAELRGDDPRPYVRLARLLAAKGDLAGTVAAAQEADRLAGVNPEAITALGAVYLEKGLVDPAITLLEDALRLEPELAEAQLQLGLAYRVAGRRSRSRALLEEAFANTSARPAVRARAKQALRFR